MRRGKSSISKVKSYKEIGEFWDIHDLSEFWDQTKRIKFEVGIESEITYYSFDKKLAEEVQSIAQERGVSVETIAKKFV